MKPSINFTRSSDSISELKEEEDAFFEGLTSTITLLSSAIIWIMIATVLIWCNAIIPGYVCLVIAGICIALWAGFHAIPAAWKWLGSFVEL